MQVMGSDLAPSRGRGQWIAIWRFIAESGNQLSPSVFAIVSALFGYVGSFGIVGFSALAVSLLVLAGSAFAMLHGGKLRDSNSTVFEAGRAGSGGAGSGPPGKAA